MNEDINMEVCKEMQKLRNWLDQNSIPWEDCSDDFRNSSFLGYEMWICRTHFMADNHKVSVINGGGTYGGYRLGDSKNNEGLLEVMSSVINNGEPVGYLTAENVIQLLKDNCHVDEIARGVKQDIAITLMNSIVGDQ